MRVILGVLSGSNTQHLLVFPKDVHFYNTLELHVHFLHSSRAQSWCAQRCLAAACWGKGISSLSRRPGGPSALPRKLSGWLTPSACASRPTRTAVLYNLPRLSQNRRGVAEAGRQPSSAWPVARSPPQWDGGGNRRKGKTHRLR